MTEGWITLPFEDCMAAIIDHRGKSPIKTSSGVPLVTAKIVKGGRIAKPEEFISEQDFDEWMRRGLPEPGDIVMTTEAPLGKVAQLDGQKVALAQRIITIRGKRDILDNTFLKFLLQSDPVQDQLRQDRAQPADERDLGGHGPSALPVVVRGLRPRPRQGRRTGSRVAPAPRRSVPGLL